MKLVLPLSAFLVSFILLLTNQGHSMQDDPANNIIEFSQANEIDNWVIVNDTVMGGRSQAMVKIKAGHLQFTGNLSLQNNGGFASTRRIYEPIPWHQKNPIQITIKGDGRDYQFRLRTDRYMDGVAYVKTFSTDKNQWQTITFSEADFIPQFRGRLVKDAKQLAFTDITQLGFMLADKQPGEFELNVKEIVQLPLASSPK